MKCVVDSNMLQSPALRSFLTASQDNVAVLPDYVWMEIYKQQSLSSVVRALAVISDRATQITVLESGHRIAGLDPRDPWFRRDMRRGNASDDLRSMREAVRQATAGEPDPLRQLSARWSEAAENLHGMDEGAVAILESLPEMAAVFGPDEVRRIRTGSPYTPEMTATAFGMAEQIYEALAAARGLPASLTMPHATDAYLYRLALGIVIHLLHWIKTGSQRPKRIDKARNDFIDIGIAVCATYFDDLLTDDQKARRMFNELTNALHFIEASWAARGAAHG